MSLSPCHPGGFCVRNALLGFEEIFVRIVSSWKTEKRFKPTFLRGCEKKNSQLAANAVINFSTNAGSSGVLNV